MVHLLTESEESLPPMPLWGKGASVFMSQNRISDSSLALYWSYLNAILCCLGSFDCDNTTQQAMQLAPIQPHLHNGFPLLLKFHYYRIGMTLLIVCPLFRSFSTFHILPVGCQLSHISRRMRVATLGMAHNREREREREISFPARLLALLQHYLHNDLLDAGPGMQGIWLFCCTDSRLQLPGREWGFEIHAALRQVVAFEFVWATLISIITCAA